MNYETEREIKIKIIGAVQEWAEEHGIETSAEMEADVASRIFDNLDGYFSEGKL